MIYLTNLILFAFTENLSADNYKLSAESGLPGLSLLGSMGVCWGCFWAYFGVFWGVLGHIMGVFLDIFGCVLGIFGTILGCFWPYLGHFWGTFSHFWGTFGAHFRGILGCIGVFFWT